MLPHNHFDGFKRFLIASTGNNLCSTERQKAWIPLSLNSCWNHSMSEAIVNRLINEVLGQCCSFRNNCEVFICQRLTWLRRIIQTFDGVNYDWFKNGYFLTILTQCGYFLSELDMERSSCFIILTRESNSCSLVNQQLIFKTFYREH